MNDRQQPVIAVFASGSGTTFQATADAIHDGLVDFKIGLVITDREEAGVLARVAEVNHQYGFDIKTVIINKKRYPEGAQGRGQTRAEGEALLRALRENNIDHLVLMGCMRILAPQVVEVYGWKPEHADRDPHYQGMYFARMSNTHPGILPATADTYGVLTQEKALGLGLGETAHTFQVVAVGVDAGPVIAEHRVRIFAPANYAETLADTPDHLFARVQRVEKAHLPMDIDTFLKDQRRFMQVFEQSAS
jgi:phosphoribosylglycinamide formyltransferase-1